MIRVGFLSLLLTISFCLLTACNDIDFDSRKWQNWEESEAAPSLRWRMAEDLISTHDLKGMSTDEVVELLGEPDNKNEGKWSYFLGYSGEGIDTGSLILTFKEDTLVKYEVWHG